VSVKNSKKDQNPQGPAKNHKAEFDLKEMLGIQPQSSTTTTTTTATNVAHCEGELKKMLGINIGGATPVVDMATNQQQQQKASGEDVIKSLLGVKPTGQQTPPIELSLSDDAKLMNLIGVKPTASTVQPTHVEHELHQSKSEPVISNFEKVRKFENPTILYRNCFLCIFLFCNLKIQISVIDIGRRCGA